MRHLDQAVTDAGGIALRCGGFYAAPNDGMVEPVHRRQFPIIGDGGGVTSFVHLDDDAAATAIALGHARHSPSVCPAFITDTSVLSAAAPPPPRA